MEPVIQGLSRRDRERIYRRDEILSAAKNVFAERGFNQATLSEIAAKAEFGKGTIYNYFPDGKEEILVAIFNQVYDRLKSIIEDSFSVDPAPDFPEQMKAFLNRSFQFFDEHINLFMILIKESERMQFGENPARVEFFVRRHNEIIEALATPLEQAMNRGNLRPMAPHFLAHMIMVNLKGCLIRHCPQRAIHASPAASVPAEQLADVLTEFILYGSSEHSQKEASTNRPGL